MSLEKQTSVTSWLSETGNWMDDYYLLSENHKTTFNIFPKIKSQRISLASVNDF